MQRLLSAPSDPVKLGGRNARAPPSAAAGWPRLPRPAKTETDGKTATPGKRARREKIAACGVCTEPCSPPRVAVCWAKHSNEAASTGPRVHHAAAVRLHEAKCFCATHATATSNRSVHASLRGRALQCGCCWNVPHGTLRRCAAWGCTSEPTAVASAYGGQNEPAYRTIDWGRVAGDGGWGAGAAGRTSTGATSAISASKRGSSGAQASSL
jgi:hypothetical protein